MKRLLKKMGHMKLMVSVNEVKTMPRGLILLIL